MDSRRPRRSDSSHDRDQPRSSIARPAFWRLSAGFTAAGLAFVNVLVISRALGPDGRGDIVLFTTIAILSANVVFMGVQDANANIAAAEAHLRPTLAANSLLLALIFGISASLVLAAAMELLPALRGELSAGLVGLALVSIPLLILQAYMTGLALADRAFAAINGSLVASVAISLAANVALLVVDALTVATAAATWFLGQVVAAGFLSVYVVWHVSGIGRPDLSLARRCLRFGTRAHAGRVMMFASFRVDAWLLGSLKGSTELGLYSVATALGEGLFQIPMAVSYVQRPELVRSSKDDAAIRASSAFRAALLVTASLAAATALFAPLIVESLFGDSFSGAVSNLRLLLPGTLGIVALEILGFALVSRGSPGRTSLGIAVGFAVVLALDVLLIPRYGGNGAAVASSAGYLAGGASVALIYTHYHRTRLRILVPSWTDIRRLVSSGQKVLRKDHV